MAGTKKSELTEEQKSQLRLAVAQYRVQHPEANSKEIFTNLDLAFKDQVTEPMLRGFVSRLPRATPQEETPQPEPAAPLSAAPRRTRATATAQPPQVSKPQTRRGRKPNKHNQVSLERLIQNLTQLRQHRTEIETQIGNLEDEVRDRLHQQLGADYTRQLFETPD